MSVTFYPGKLGKKIINGVEFTIYHEQFPPDFDDKPTNDPEYGLIYPQNPWSLNLTNMNFVSVISILYPDVDLTSYCGKLEPVDLLEKIKMCLELIELAPSLDAVVEPTAFADNGGMRMIGCGKRKGYLAEKLTQLKLIAEEAQKLGGLVIYN